MDLVLSSELHSIISHCIAASDELNKIGLRYDLQCESIFNRMFLNLKNEYYIGMMNIAMKTLNLDHERIKCTREYFFICDLYKEDTMEFEKNEVTKQLDLYLILKNVGRKLLKKLRDVMGLLNLKQIFLDQRIISMN